MDRWLNHPTSLKIISVVLALLLWAVVHFDPETPNTVASLIETRPIESVKVQAVGLDDKKYRLRVINPETVRIKVRGNRTDLLSSNLNDYKVTVDLRNITEGIHELPLNVATPRRIQLIEQSHDRVTVQLEPIQTNEFEVRILTSGTPAHDYKAGTPVVKPNSRVFVTLPENQMNQVEMVGATIDIAGEEDTIIRKRVKIIVYDKDGVEIPEAVVDPAVVEVEVPITKPLKQVPIRVGTTGKLPNGISLVSMKPEVDAVTIYGPQVELDKYEFFDNAVVNLSSIKQSGTVVVDLKPMLGVASVNPAKLNIEVEVAASVTRTIPQVPIAVIGLSEGLDYEFATPEKGRADIQVKGAPSLLAELVARDIRLIVDLNGLPPGEHTVPVEAELPRYVESDDSGQLKAKVTIFDPEEAAAAQANGTGEELSAADNGSGNANANASDNDTSSQETDIQSGAENERNDSGNADSPQAGNNSGAGNGANNSTS